MWGFRARGTAIVGLLAGFALWAAPLASATITTSNITSPPDLTFTTSPSTPDVSGTSDGTTGDHVDVRCYEGSDDSVGLSVASNIAAEGNGSFVLTHTELNLVFGHLCILRAVPAGTTPANLNPFSGPRVAIGTAQWNMQGPAVGFFVFAQQLTAANDYYPYGECGLCDGYLLDSSLAPSTTTFFGNDWFDYLDGSGTRSEVRVDGADAYSPATAQQINLHASGFPLLTWSYSLNPANGDWTISETDQLVRCADPTYPPDDTSCASFVSTGVRVNRAITQGHDGHLVFITDRYVSTDGHDHSLDLLPFNEQFFGNGGPDVAYEFPGESSFSSHTVDDAVSFADSSPGAIYINVQGSTDGATDTGQGAIVFDRPASPATFIDPDGNQFEFHQTGLATPSCTPSFTFAYAQDYLAANIQSLAQTAIGRFNGSPATVCSPTATPTPSAGPTGRRAAALKKCKKKYSRRARRKCRKKAKRLPV
jgi:hypothetical protein